MQFIGINILSVSYFSSAAFAQPTPDMEKGWESEVRPRIEAKMKTLLTKEFIDNTGQNSVMIRAQLEKNGRLNHLRFDRGRCASNLPKEKFEKLKETFKTAVETSEPFPYASVKDSLLKHLGFFAIYTSSPEKLEVGITMPDDYPHH